MAEQADSRTLPTTPPRYLLVVAEAPNGAWQRLHGQMEVHGGKVMQASIPVAEWSQWLAVLSSAKVFLEAHTVPDSNTNAGGEA